MPAEKKGGIKKQEVHQIAVVMETSHGHFLTAHKHYDVKIIEVPVGLTIDMVEESAEKAALIGSKLLGVKSRVLAVQHVEVHNAEDIKKGAEKIRKEMGL